MRWKETVNGVLSRATGHRLERTGSAPRRTPALRRGDRLVDRPTFVLCTLRSGSTLLRVLLNSHSQIHAPHELHLRYVDVQFARKWARRSMKELGLDESSLEYLLWDRILHRELSASGKRMIVDKTPNNVFIAQRLKECWPDARFLFLLRHPGAIARSRAAYVDHDNDSADNATVVHSYCEALERARQAYGGHTLRYEDLTADPATVMRGVCDYLEVPWEPRILDYGRFDHGRYKAGLGDWEEKIRSGRVQAPEPPPAPEDTPDALLPIARAWGYLAAASSPPARSPSTSAGIG